MTVFDLNNPPKFTNDLQKNILILKKSFGSRFKIKDGDIEMPAYLYLVIEPDNKKMKYYSLVYDIEDREDWLLPFKIAFLDMEKAIINNNCYIANIQKIETISGTIMVEIVLKLLKILHVEKAILHDGAHIDCGNSEVDLSFFKLLEKGITFYQKFGFKFKMQKYASDIISYDSTENMVKVLHKNLKDIHKIKLDYYREAYVKILDIIKQIIKNQDYDNVKIYLHHPYKPYIVKKDRVREFILSTVRDIDSLLAIIKNSKKKYLTETMIELLYIDCNTYLLLEDLIFKNQFIGIKYRGKGIYLKHSIIFRNLRHIRNNAIFEIAL